jgi:hypothetical protein
MQKILIISKNKSLRGGYKAAVELGNALKTLPFNNVKFFRGGCQK